VADPGADARAAELSGRLRCDPVHTQVGHALGTLAYMPPEQAQGAVGKNTPRSDVFGLGGILAVILTGQPPFVGSTAGTAWRKAVHGDVGECLARLDACGADPELVALCKRCLSPDPADRPTDAGEVARAVAAFQAAADERARRAELERAKAEVAVAEQRKRRQIQAALGLAFTSLVALGGAFAWWQDRQAGQRRMADAQASADYARAEGEHKATAARLNAEQRFRAEQARDAVRAGLALAADLRDQSKFRPARAALAQAAALATGSAPEMLPDIERAQHDLAFVERLDDIRYRKWAWVAEPGRQSRFNTQMAAPEYRLAFATHGIDPTALDPGDTAARIAASPVKTALVTALDDWAVHEPNEATRDRLLDAARRADPGPWSDRLRDPAVRRNKAKLAKLAAEAGADPAGRSAMSLLVLAELMGDSRLDPVPLLAAARVQHPSDFDLAFAHGRNSTGSQRIGPYETARALRPENQAVWINLGVALMDEGNLDGAVAAYRQAIKHDPTFAKAHTNLGAALRAKGDVDGAIAAYRDAIKHDPTDAYAHNNLGNALRAKGDLDGAVAAYRQAIRHDPTDADMHANLGDALTAKGDLDGAIAAYKEAVRHNPRFAHAHTNLGVVLKVRGDVDGAIAAYKEALRHDPTSAAAHTNLGLALASKGDMDGAIDAFREAVKLDPKDVKARVNLKLAQVGKERMEAALAAALDAIKRDPNSAAAHNGLGLALLDKRDLDGAVSAFKESIRLNPDLVAAHANLATAYLQQKKYPEARACARAAVQAHPTSAVLHARLGDALFLSGDIPGARAALTEAARLDAQWAAQLARLPPVEVAPAPRPAKR
jgi:tetratricopeptide (TPR) repeat protein